MRLRSDDSPEIIEIVVAKPDSHGNLIVMVSLEKVKKLVLVPSTTLMLIGKTTGEEGVYFLGTDVVRVKD